MASSPASAELRSWKEIASYLGVSVKTAQTWERDRGLPVHRMPGQRSLVRSTTAEIDAWRTQSPSLPEADPDSPAPVEMARIPRWAVIGCVLSVLGVAGIVVGYSRSMRVPAAYHLEPNALEVRDAAGQRLWRQTFDTRLESGYTTSFPPGRMVHIGDLDGDAAPEVLFVQQPADAFSPDRGLWCFDKEGNLRWKFTVTREVRTAAQKLPPPYRILQTAVGPLKRGGPVKIVIASVQVPWWATQIAILDANGRLEREYWHSGALFALEVGDADKDGHSEIYAGGISNSKGQAALVVLDPRTMQGASVENDPAFQLIGHGVPAGAARLFFPRTCTAHGQPYNALRQLSIQDGNILAEVWEHPYGPEQPSVFYTLTSQLALRHAGVSDRFRAVHDALHAAGVIQHALTPGEIAGLKPSR